MERSSSSCIKEIMPNSYTQNNLYESLFQRDSIGLYSGKMGAALYRLHYARVYADEKQEETALTLIDEIQQAINADTHFGYAEGLAGMGSALCYLFREGFVCPQEDDYFSELDNYFFNKVYFEKHADLSRATGLIGIGCYMFHRIKDLPTDNYMSLQLRCSLLLIQDVLFAALGMNGYTYPYLKSDSLTELSVIDMKGFLEKMLKSGLCPELTRKALNIIDETYHTQPTIFEDIEVVYTNNDMQAFRNRLKCIADLPDLTENSPIRLLANLQLQDMSLPSWWELF